MCINYTSSQVLASQCTSCDVFMIQLPSPAHLAESFLPNCPYLSCSHSCLLLILLPSCLPSPFFFSRPLPTFYSIIPPFYLLPFLRPLISLSPSSSPSTGGLAVDWVTGKLYWSDAEKVRIEVADLEGRNKTVMFSERVDRPRAIVLEPTLR